MPTTNFTAGTAVTSAWLNEIDQLRFDNDGSAYLKHTATGTGAAARDLNDVLDDGLLLSSNYSTLQEAVTAAAGKVLRIVGTYALGSTTITVPANTWLDARGAALTWTSNVTGLSFTNGGGIVGGTLTGAGNGPYSDAGRAIACSGTNNNPSAPTYVTGPIIRDVTITEWAGYGVRAQYVNGGQVIGCNITEIGYAGVAVLSCNDVVIEKNIIDGVTPGSSGGDAYGIFFDRLETGNETVEPRTYRTRVAYNVVKNVSVSGGDNGQGIDTHASVDAQIIGNMIDTCEVGIVLTASSISGTQQLACQRANVIGNTIKGAKLGYGILVSGAISGSTVNEYAQDIVLNGNILQGHGISGDNLSGAYFCQGTKRLTVSGGSIKEPACYGINLGANNLGFNISNLTIIDPHDNTVTIPGAIHINGDNNTGRFSDIVCQYETSGLATYVAKVSTRIASGLTGLDISFGPMHFLGIASGVWDWSEATSTGINAGGVLRQRGSGTLSGGTLAVVFEKRFPVGLTPKVFIGQQTANICRAGTVSVTGFTATGTSSESFVWEATT